VTEEFMSVPVEQLRQLRRDSTMETSRLEHAILQAVINHIAEHPLTREQIVLALINVATYWQKKIILSILTDKRWKELNGK
jgi:hypothetical protein